MGDFGTVRRPIGHRHGLGLAMTAIALVHAAPSLAQDAGAPQESAAAGTADQIIVTGTRIARDGFQSPTPLTVVTQQEILNQSPTNNLADFINQIGTDFVELEIEPPAQSAPYVALKAEVETAD